MKEQQVVDGQKKKVTVDAFFEKYDSLTSDKAQELYLESIIYPSDYYVPYFEKSFYANKVLETANFNKEGNVHFDSIKQYLCYIWAVIHLYTYFDIPESEWNIIFDKLNQRKMIDKIIEKLPLDYQQFEIVFGLAVADFEKNYRALKIDSIDIMKHIESSVLKILNDMLGNIITSDAIHALKAELENLS